MLEILQHYKAECLRLAEDNARLVQKLQVHNEILLEQAALKAQLKLIENELQPAHAALQREVEALKAQARTATAKLGRKTVLVQALRRQVEDLQASLNRQSSTPLLENASDAARQERRSTAHYETKLKILTAKIKSDQALIQRLQEELDRTYSDQKPLGY